MSIFQADMAMELTSAINRVAESFASARKEEFSGHPLARFIRTDLIDSAKEAAGSAYPTTLRITASPGKGRWNESPWLAFLDTDVTMSAQSGYYPVFLFEPGMKSYCLVLGQGADSVTKTFGTKEALKIVANRAEQLRGAVHNWKGAGFSDENFQTMSRMHADVQAAVSDLWSQSVAFGKRYSVAAPPSEQSLRNDVQTMLKLYSQAVRELGTSFTTEDQIASNLADSGEMPQTGLDGALKVSEHKQIERRLRNQKLVKIVKQKYGHRCQACQIDLTKAYPEWGKEFIEAHHIKPLSLAPSKGLILSVDDFCVLCPTCHRIIHKMGCPPLMDFAAGIAEEMRFFHGKGGTATDMA